MSRAAAGTVGASGSGAGGSGAMMSAAGMSGASGAGAAGTSSGAVGAAGDMSMGTSNCTLPAVAAGDHTFMINSANGQQYSYVLSIPTSVDTTQKSPLLVHWHALSSSPEEARMLTSVDAKAEAAEVIVVYPRSPDQSWDVGSCCTSTGRRRVARRGSLRARADQGR